MYSNTHFAALAAAITLAPLVSAHGHVSGVVAGGQYYPGTTPEWFYQATKPDTPGWYAENQDNGFVAPSAFANGDIICHRGASVGGSPVPVAAGETLDIQWNTWPESHHGPVITYLAAVSGEFSSVSKEDLEFFKIDEVGLLDGSSAPGNWGSDELMANNLTSTVTIPSDLAAGNYVVRHEIIALHSAGDADGAQNYPQCINIEVTGSGSANPCADGADCAVGTALYTPTDAGILVSIYQALASYEIPGPALYGDGSDTPVKVPETTASATSAVETAAPTSTVAATSTLSSNLTMTATAPVVVAPTSVGEAPSATAPASTVISVPTSVGEAPSATAPTSVGEAPTATAPTSVGGAPTATSPVYWVTPTSPVYWVGPTTTTAVTASATSRAGYTHKKWCA